MTIPAREITRDIARDIARDIDLPGSGGSIEILRDEGGTVLRDAGGVPLTTGPN